MKYYQISLIIILSCLVAGTTVAKEGEKGHTGMQHSQDMDKTTEHTAMEGMFKHHATTDGIRSEYQVMSLASMNMKDPAGATHHIMVTFFDAAANRQIKAVAGKIKVIGPDGKEQVGTLKDYSGTYAANFTFGQTGKYGVICLFKTDGKQHLAKFWYHHH
jgi:hypothetical protein